MACPYFLPRARLDDGAWDPPPRMPLGASWTGVCSLDASTEIPERELRDLCNLGYVRGQCARFPTADHADAHRFSLVSRDGLDTTVIYVIEKAHAPIEHGLLHFSAEVCEDEVGPQLKCQARAFVACASASRVETLSTPLP